MRTIVVVKINRFKKKMWKQLLFICLKFLIYVWFFERRKIWLVILSIDAKNKYFRKHNSRKSAERKNIYGETISSKRNLPKFLRKILLEAHLHIILVSIVSLTLFYYLFDSSSFFSFSTVDILYIHSLSPPRHNSRDEKNSQIINRTFTKRASFCR